MLIYSLHILSPLVFSIDNSTLFPSADFILPDTEIMSAVSYEDPSTFMIICEVELGIISVTVVMSIWSVEAENPTTTAITIAAAAPAKIPVFYYSSH